MAHRLILVRHGKSDHRRAASDRLRPLASRGRKQLPVTAHWLVEQGMVPDVVIISPATRAQESWQQLEPILSAAGPVRSYTEEWAYTFAASDLLALLESVPDPVPTIMLVGHNPGFAELAEVLTGQAVELKTSAVAVIDFPDAGFRPGSGALVAVGRPATDKVRVEGVLL